MKTVFEIISGYGEYKQFKEFFVSACKEIDYLNKNGIWPKLRPSMNQLTNDLLLEGYPANQVQNIAISAIHDLAISFVTKSYK